MYLHHHFSLTYQVSYLNIYDHLICIQPIPRVMARPAWHTSDNLRTCTHHFTSIFPGSKQNLEMYEHHTTRLALTVVET